MSLEATFAVAAAACAALATPAGAAAPDPVVRFEVPALPLAQALPMFARQAGIQVLAPAEGFEHVVTSPLTGAYETREGLRRLIAGTGLEIASDREGTILLRVSGSASMRPDRVIDGAPALLEEVVVTALRRESTASRTPIAIATASGERLEAMGAASLTDLQPIAPGLNLTEINPGQRRLSLRGAQSAGESTVALYIGDTPVSGPNSATSDPSSITPDLDLFDLERVEILKGPQGTLFGSGAMSGAVRLLYNRPDMTASSGKVVVSHTNVENGGSGASLHLMINRPLIEDRLGMRFVVYDTTRPGFVDNVRLGLSDVNSVRTHGGRLWVSSSPRSGTILSLNALLQDQEVRDAGVVTSATTGLSTDAAARLPFPNRLSLLGLAVEHDFGLARLSATASVFEWNSTKYIDTTQGALLAREEGRYCSRYVDVDGSCDAAQLATYRAYIDSILPLVGYQPMTVRSVVQEARLDSPGGRRLGWTLGFFLEDRRDSSVSSTVEADQTSGGVQQPLSHVFMRSSGVDLIQRAVYGELSWSPLDRLSFRLGARRYDYEKTSRAQVLQTSYINASVAGPETRHDNDASGWVRRATASYRFNDRVTAYAQYAEGFRPGGVNNTPGLDPALVVYAADGSSNREVGLKTVAADGRLLMDFAAFEVRWTDMQVAARVPNFNFIANAGEATIRGFEVEGQVSLMDSLTARWSLNLIDGRLTSQPSDAAFVATGGVGDRIPYEPNIRFSGSIEHRRSLGRALSLTTSGEAIHVGEAGSGFDRSDPYFETMGRYWLVHLGVRLESVEWSTSLRLENALNAQGVSWAASRAEYERNRIITAPRTLRLSIERRW